MKSPHQQRFVATGRPRHQPHFVQQRYVVEQERETHWAKLAGHDNFDVCMRAVEHFGGSLRIRRTTDDVTTWERRETR